jgi:hypothetical protein
MSSVSEQDFKRSHKNRKLEGHITNYGITRQINSNRSIFDADLINGLVRTCNFDS